MKKEIIDLSNELNIDIIGFCNTKSLVCDKSKYLLQEKLKYKSTFQVGDISDKDLSNKKYDIYNTAIVIGISYSKREFKNKEKVYLSSCSWGIDYHIILKEKLIELEKYLNNKNYISKVFVDNNPLDERLLAYNAGLGFFGKNNLLINEKLGSYFFIGVLLTDALIESDEICTSKCSGCNKCINACPTKAIDENGILNSNKCLSYLTQKKEIDEEYKQYFNNCIYGCDKCINSCPYNKDRKSNNFNSLNNEEIYANDFLNMSETEFKKKFSKNSCFWRGKKVLDRNINIYKNNLK